MQPLEFFNGHWKVLESVLIFRKSWNKFEVSESVNSSQSIGWDFKLTRFLMNRAPWISFSPFHLQTFLFHLWSSSWNTSGWANRQKLKTSRRDVRSSETELFLNVAERRRDSQLFVWILMPERLKINQKMYHLTDEQLLQQIIVKTEDKSINY